MACHQNPEHACGTGRLFHSRHADDAIKRAIVEREISDPLTQSGLAAQKVREIAS
jgi:hypothetical protein